MEAGPVERALTRELRRSVLRPTLTLADVLPGEDVPGVVDIGARAADGTVVSTCLLYEEDCAWRPDERPAWHLRQMATDPAWRRRGAGRAVLDACVEYVRAQGGVLLWCHARVVAAEFYAAAGWLLESGESLRDGLPHVDMALPL